QPKALWPQILGKVVYAGNVARGSIKAVDETKLYRIGADAEDDGNRAGRSLGRERCCRAARCGDDGHLALHKLGHQCRHAIELILSPTIFDYNIAAIDEPASLRPSRNAAARWARASEVPSWRKPTTGIAGCCARAASGHAVAPKRRAMNSRRLMSLCLAPRTTPYHSVERERGCASQQKLVANDRFGSFTSFPPSWRVRFA